MKVKAHKTYTPSPEDIERKWWIVDAEGQTLGRLASTVAPILRGKHKPIFTPNLDTGDFVIVINAGKVAVTGKRLDDKMYYRHSGYNSGLKEINLRDQLKRFPIRPIEDAIRGMLPKNSLGRTMFKKLKVYPEGEHPHEAQQPEVLKIGKE
ncbi:MAG: 50S ribosomal protein L13 [Chloroflexota bacterium]|nr:50S ribosomal protein L13 [Chloroflexota bacterium]